MDLIDVALKFLQGLTGVASVFIAYFIFRLGRQRRTDAWLRSFNELHQTFWTDADLREVRSWIANDEKYRQLDAVLGKRFAGRSMVPASEYETLEKLDKFFTFLLRAHEVASQVRGHGNLWDRLYLQHWPDDIVQAKRHRLWHYLAMFYRVGLPVRVSAHEPSGFIAEVRKMCGKPTHNEVLQRTTSGGGHMGTIRLGVWIWGSVTAVIAIAVFVIVVVAAIHIDPAGGFASSAPRWLPKVYKVLQDLSTLIGAAIGFSALAWAYFFQAMTK